MSNSKHSLLEFVADHPRMMGVLFAMALVLSQTGTVAAGNGGSIF